MEDTASSLPLGYAPSAERRSAEGFSRQSSLGSSGRGFARVAHSFEAAGWSFDSPTQTREVAQQLAIEATEAELRDTPEALQRSARQLSDRAVVACWVGELTGEQPPHETDAAFRTALKDRNLLCRALKVVRPNADLPVAQGAGGSTAGQVQAYESVTRFLDELRSCSFPSAAIFDRADLDAPDADDRPQITNCLMTLKKCHEHEQDLQLSPRSIATRPLVPGSPTRSGASPLLPSSFSAASHQHSPRTYAHPQPSPRLPPTNPQPSPRYLSRALSPRVPTSASQGVYRGPDATPEVNYGGLMSHYFGSDSKAGSFSREELQAAQQSTAIIQRATHDLGERLGPYRPPAPTLARYGSTAMAAVPPEAQPNLDKVSPILESVLGSLTQEYEKKLFDKDQDVKGLQGRLIATQKELQAARGELREAMERGVTHLPPGGLSVGTPGEARELQRAIDREKELQGELRGLQRAHSQMQAECVRLRDEHALMQEQVARCELALEGHQQVVEDNRKLYNQVLDLKGNIRVFCRVRPLGATGDPSQGCVEVGLDGDIAVYNPRDGKRKTYKYDRVFGEGSSQVQVYEDTSALIRSVLDGFNVCIFAYGQTGSGKTHTMAGTNVEHMDGRGINYRALDDLFELNRRRSDEVVYEVRVQLLEIYNEQLRDLLDDRRTAPKLDIRTTERSGLNVPGAKQVEVSTTEDVLAVMAVGSRNRAVAETKMNERSSRSHSVLTIIVDGQTLATGERTHGCLHLIDLAGSERVGKSEATGDRLEEAKHINRSLSALGDVMAALAAKDKGHVPYRNSKLTQLLQDSLCGQAKAMMFIHVSPEDSSFGESVSTLQFGARVSEISLGAAKKNVESGALFEARELARGAEGAVEREQSARRGAEARARTAEVQLESANREVERLRAELEAMRSCGLDSPTSLISSPSGLNSDPSVIAAVYPPGSQPSSPFHQALRSGMKASPGARTSSADLRGALSPKSPRNSPGGLPPPSLLKASHRLSTGQLTPSPLSVTNRAVQRNASSPAELPISLAAAQGGRGLRRTESEGVSPNAGSLTARSYNPDKPSNIPKMPMSARGSMSQSTVPKRASNTAASNIRSSVSGPIAGIQRTSSSVRASIDASAALGRRASFARVPDSRSSSSWK